MKKYILPLIILSSILVLDQWTKNEVQARFFLWETLPVIPDFFSITYVQNPGAAFGLLANAPASFRVPFFIAIPLLALGILLYMIYQTPAHKKGVLFSFSLILGGAIGNLIDRFYLGYVVDFLLFYWRQYHFPAFNVADFCICLGVGLLMLDLYWETCREKKRAQARKGEPVYSCMSRPPSSS